MIAKLLEFEIPNDDIYSIEKGFETETNSLTKIELFYLKRDTRLTMIIKTVTLYESIARRFRSSVYEKTP